MYKKFTKAGLIQNFPHPGDFSTNLRVIIQGYRECLNHGADIVFAPAAALCGLEPRDLTLRRSFYFQCRAALDALAKEVTTAPLILGAYTIVEGKDAAYVGLTAGEDEEDYWRSKDMDLDLVPFLIESNSVTEMTANELSFVEGNTVYVDMTEEEQMPDITADFIVRMPSKPWYATSFQDDYELRCWEASLGDSIVVCIRPAGTCAGNVYGGGSGVYTKEGGAIGRLPLFEPGVKVFDSKRNTRPLPLPEPVEQMAMGIQKGIRDNVRNNCFSGVCIPLDHPHSALMALLAVEAIGAANVCGISFDPENKLASHIGISCLTPPTAKLEEELAHTLGEEEKAALIDRMHTAIALTHAESRGLMLFSPLARRHIMLGEFRLYGQSGGHYAPLGTLYDIDVYLLSAYYKEKNPDAIGTLGLPPDSYTCRIIHELADLNTPPSDLLNDRNFLFKESDVRLIQRKILASALRRSQLPVVMHVDPIEEQLRFPIMHRMND